MLWPRPEIWVGRHAMPRTPPARRRSSHTSRRTSSVRPPTQSRPHVPPRRKQRAKARGDWSAGGSATSSRRRSASSYSTTSGCGTTSAGRCFTAKSASGRPDPVARIASPYVAKMRGMLDERLGVPVALGDHGLGLVVVEVDVVLQRSRVLGPQDLHALSGQALELLNLALVKLEPSDTLKLTPPTSSLVVVNCGPDLRPGFGPQGARSV